MPSLKDSQALVLQQVSIREKYETYTHTITLCAGTACQACGCLPVVNVMRQYLEKHELTEKIHLRTTGCHGFCEQGPLAIIEPGNIFYSHISENDVEEIITKTIGNGEIIDRLLYIDPVSGSPIKNEKDIPFYAAQDRVLLGDNLKVSPRIIGDYLAIGGYSALAKVLDSMTQDEILSEIKDSGLRGRGGGGFPTGRKWEQCRDAEGDEHYVICNADEGDPGAYMDRSLLEGNPHSVLEGMMIGAYAIGAREGFVYVRKEYPLAVHHINIAIDQAREHGLLGQNILDSDFNFDIKVVRGGGAFVCGESTALMASLEGKVGEPRAKDVHTVERGYKDQPTTLNNVETWANIPKIILNGSGWYSAKGTDSSKGTKIFTITGQVKNTGLIEVEMGASLHKIIYDIGGGAKNGREIKAVQTGGPSGGCLPVSLFDLPVDFDSLYEADSMMGSGGLVVLDNSTCMVDISKYFLKFLQDESCGKCTPCRIGVSRMLEIVEDISEGRATMDQFDLLEDLAWTISVASLCALGKTAPNPVLSTLKYFRKEFESHVKDRCCPAGVCQALIKYTIDPDLCSQCGECVDVCPHDAIKEDDIQLVIDDTRCEKCGICEEVCPTEAIQKR